MLANVRVKKAFDSQAFLPAYFLWQKAADLAGIHDSDAVAKLPPEEQEACKKLWADVAALLKKVEEKK
jgi:hypothetical protein